MNINIVPLGAIPVLVSENARVPTEQEHSFVNNIKYIPTSRMNNFISESKRVLDFDEMAEVKKFCQSTLDFYSKEVLKIEQDFYITNSWTTKNPFGAEHRAHEHRNSIFSGVYYFNAPSGNITFFFKNGYSRGVNLSYKVSEYNIWNMETYTVSPKNGMILIFPSYLYHEVEPNESNEDRRMLAFNSFVKGEFGSEKSVDKLSIL